MHYGINSIFPTRLRELMEENEISQIALADFLGISRVTVAHMMHGKKVPKITEVYEIAKIFRVPMSYLIVDMLDET